MDMGKCFAACISLLCWAIVTSSSFASVSIPSGGGDGVCLLWAGKSGLTKEGATRRQRASISKYDPLVKKHARRYGFDWRLISAQMYAESSFRPNVVSHAGAVGLMQIMPATAKWLGVDPKLLTKPETSISLGCYYDWRLYAALKEIDIERDRLAIMLASYNCGPGRMRRARRQSSNGSWDNVKPYLPKETQRYVPKIFTKYAEYRKMTL